MGVKSLGGEEVGRVDTVDGNGNGEAALSFFQSPSLLEGNEIVGHAVSLDVTDRCCSSAINKHA